jgi:hypothetical protein
VQVSSIFVFKRRLTLKAEPPPACDANRPALRDGTDRANGGSGDGSGRLDVSAFALKLHFCDAVKRHSHLR